jgi:hypothetical protein
VLVIAQASNEHLDDLNGHAQAIRHQSGEVGPEALAVTGRPCRLHACDQVQIRNTVRHPDLGQIRDGTTGRVRAVEPENELLTLRMFDQRHTTFGRGQIDAADIRLSYVQHPFPAQGQTTDTTELIVGEHTTQDGSYVALTRARYSSHIHAGLELFDGDNGTSVSPPWRNGWGARSQTCPRSAHPSRTRQTSSNSTHTNK